MMITSKVSCTDLETTILNRMVVSQWYGRKGNEQMAIAFGFIRLLYYHNLDCATGNGLEKGRWNFSCF